MDNLIEQIQLVTKHVVSEDVVRGLRGISKEFFLKIIFWHN